MDPIVTISKITRSSILVTYGVRQMTILGEAYERGYGSPDFVAYLSSMKGWNPPNDQDPFDDETRQKIISGVKQRIEERKMTIEFE